MMRKQKILFDVHGCLADFAGGCIDALNKNYPTLGWTIEDIINWEFWNDIQDDDAKKYILEKMSTHGFISTLPVHREAQYVYEQLLDIGHNVRICTTPLPGKKEKSSRKAVYAWVNFHLGTQAATNMIFSFDKTQVSGDVIIDDKPVLTSGKKNIQFRHWLIVDHPYNRNLPADSTMFPVGRIKTDWSNWQEEFAKLELI